MKWTKTARGVSDIPTGDWLVIMENGEKGYCKSRKGANCTLHIINGHFHFDKSPVVAYMPFPEFNEGEVDA